MSALDEALAYAKEVEHADELPESRRYALVVRGLRLLAGLYRQQDAVLMPARLAEVLEAAAKTIEQLTRECDRLEDLRREDLDLN